MTKEQALILLKKNLKDMTTEEKRLLPLAMKIAGQIKPNL